MMRVITGILTPSTGYYIFIKYMNVGFYLNLDEIIVFFMESIVTFLT